MFFSCPRYFSTRAFHGNIEVLINIAFRRDFQCWDEISNPIRNTHQHIQKPCYESSWLRYGKLNLDPGLFMSHGMIQIQVRTPVLGLLQGGRCSHHPATGCSHGCIAPPVIPIVLVLLLHRMRILPSCTSFRRQKSYLAS